MNNVDPAEIQKFNAVASKWWDLNGEFKPLHEINPLRLEYIEERVGALDGRKVLDVGCGGGILSESMAARGAKVTAIDLSPDALQVAKLHLYESGHSIDYREIPAEELAEELPGTFDVVTCMEMLEHVPDPSSIIAACAKLVKPGGHIVFSTINRSAKSFLFAIVGAEYVLNLVPRGTHEYSKFIRPSELAEWVRTAKLERHNLTGMHYNPVTKHYWLADNVDVNYFMHTTKPA